MTYRLQEARSLANIVRYHFLGASGWVLPDLLDHGFDNMIDPRPKHNLLMTFNGRALGTVRMTDRRDENKSAELWKLSIAKGERGKGHGDHLLRLTERYAAAQGFRMLCLKSVSEKKVVEFYERNGFEEAQWEEYVAHGMDSGLVPMIKWLAPVKGIAPCGASNDQPAHMPSLLPQPALRGSLHMGHDALS